ncbi:MAG: hypothetical protein ACI87O_000553 [Planctomycetota bacterium]|jgi:hypothetical protein
MVSACARGASVILQETMDKLSRNRVGTSFKVPLRDAILILTTVSSPAHFPSVRTLQNDTSRAQSARLVREGV